VCSAPSLEASHKNYAVERINRPLSSSNNPASLTSRLGATINIEQDHVRFLGDLILNLRDCSGQDAFMDSYLSIQRSTILQHVCVLIYVFEVSIHDAAKDAAYYRDFPDTQQEYSPEAGIFILVHKMDLVTGDRTTLLERRTAWELQAESGAVPITVLGRAFTTRRCTRYALPKMLSHARYIFSLPPPPLSHRVSGLTSTGVVENRPHHHPNAAVLTNRLITFAQPRSAPEANLFERTTFDVVATSSPPDLHEQANNLTSTPYALTSELIKALNHSCAQSFTPSRRSCLGSSWR
jgi:Ras-related GTP-binding protein A/B